MTSGQLTCRWSIAGVPDSLGCSRQTDVKLRPVSIGTLQRDVAAMGPSQFPGGAQAKPAPGNTFVTSPAIEALE
jgi:hypothetical protein